MLNPFNLGLNNKSKGLLISLLLLASLTACINTLLPVSAEDAVYDNYVSFQVMPDESILMQLGGSVSEDLYYDDGLEALLNLHTEYSCETLTEGRSDIEFRSTIELSPKEAALLANLELLITSEGDSAHQVIDILVDYPGFIGLDGSLEITLDEPSFVGVMDLALSATLYYTIYPQEQIEQMLMMLPLMETMLASQVAQYSGGNLSLSRLEIVSSEMGLASATFTIAASLEGDFQKGIQAAATSMGVDYDAEAYELEGLPLLQYESSHSRLEYLKESFTFEITSEMTVLGDLDEFANFVKDSALDEILEEGQIDEEEEEVITEFLRPTEVSVENFQFELDYTVVADTMTASFSLEGLTLKPPSMEAFMDFLQYVSDEEAPEDFVLILEGGSAGSRSVVVNSPVGTSTPISQEGQKVVWSFASAKNLDMVTFGVESESQQSTGNNNLIIWAAGLIILLGVAGYVMMQRKA